MIELNKIYNEDCLETMSRMESGSVGLVVTSPPYNFDKGSSLGNKYNGQKDTMTFDEYFAWQRKVILEMLRVGKLCFYNIQMIAGNKPALLRLIGEFENNIREVIIWDKTYSEPAMSEKVLNSEFEFCFLLSANGGGRKIEEAQFERGKVSNIWRIPKNKGLVTTHSAAFPERLPMRAIKYFSKEGDTVYDPFIGTGTTAYAAVKLKRNFIGSEINKSYCDIANLHINKHLAQGALALSN